MALGHELPASELTERSCVSKAVVVRLPPSFDGIGNPSFKATPSGFFDNRWYYAYSSVPAVLSLGNAQLFSTPNTALTSYQYGTCKHIYTSYNTNSAVSGEIEVYNFHLGGSPGTISGTTEVMSWGTDSACVDYFVQYGPYPDVGLVIGSRASTGPSGDTYSAIVAALKSLEDSSITTMANALKPMVHNGGNPGLTTCNQACQVNQNSPSGSCPAN